MEKGCGEEGLDFFTKEIRERAWDHRTWSNDFQKGEGETKKIEE